MHVNLSAYTEWFKYQPRANAVGVSYHRKYVLLVRIVKPWAINIGGSRNQAESVTLGITKNVESMNAEIMAESH